MKKYFLSFFLLISVQNASLGNIIANEELGESINKIVQEGNFLEFNKILNELENKEHFYMPTYSSREMGFIDQYSPDLLKLIIETDESKILIRYEDHLYRFYVSLLKESNPDKYENQLHKFYRFMFLIKSEKLRISLQRILVKKTFSSEENAFILALKKSILENFKFQEKVYFDLVGEIIIKNIIYENLSEYKDNESFFHQIFNACKDGKSLNFSYLTQLFYSLDLSLPGNDALYMGLFFSDYEKQRAIDIAFRECREEDLTLLKEYLISIGIWPSKQA